MDKGKQGIGENCSNWQLLGLCLEGFRVGDGFLIEGKWTALVLKIVRYRMNEAKWDQLQYAWQIIHTKIILFAI
jgi:hypothetical protein